ncbi:MAG: right-handed parallel beta-helix repeat-containing protein [Chitinophagales bacterium]
MKNPNGNGETSGTGSIVIQNNNVTFTASPIMNNRDHAGISVYRRGFESGNPSGYPDVPTGVVVTGNTVDGYKQLNPGSVESKGYGIVIEGTNHSVVSNFINNNDIGVQEQGGAHPNANYVVNNVGDANQNDGSSANYFGRGNAPVACGNTIDGTNTYSGNTINNNTVTGSGSYGLVMNTTTGELFCSIQAAINDAQTLNGDTLEVNPGNNYNEQVLVNKSVIIKGVGLSQPTVNFTGSVTGKPTLFDVSADGVTIDNIHFNVDLSKLRSAVIASAVTLDNIVISNNVIDAYGTPAGSYGDRNAVSINYTGTVNYRVASGGVNSITFEGNTVNGSLPGSFFRSAISVDEGGGTFSGNTLQTINHDILVRFGSNGNINVTNNNFNGGGIELVEHNAGAGNINVTANIFDATFANTSAPGTAVLRLKNNQQAKTTTVHGNTFINHQWAVSLENYRSVSIDSNSFTPLAGSTSYIHIAENTKSISSNSNTIVQTTVDGSFTRNTFNGSGTSGGTAIGFYNHDSDAASFGTFTIGGSMANANEFNPMIAQFIRLDNQTGSSNAATNPTDYPDTGGWPTTMACWSQGYDIQNNKFDVGSGLQFPSAMNFTQRTALEGALFHKPDAACTGELIYFVPVHNLTQNTFYQTIQAAVNAATAGDVIEASEFTYNERVVINKSLTLQGVNESNCVLTGTGLVGTGRGILINNGVTDVTIRKLTVQNFAGANGNTDAGIYAIGGNSNLLVEHVTIKNNVGGSGFYANGPVDNVTIDSVTSTGHTIGARGIVIWNGLKTNITIINCHVFGNNCCGIELQDGTASGVTMTNNNIHDNGDNGIGLVGLQGPGENLVNMNTLLNNGRFGIEIKNPNGSGETTGAGRIVVEDNDVSRTTSIVDARDIAGIAAFRRGVLPENVDIPTGVVIQNNTVSGFTQPSTSEGFGIVAEGTNHNVSTNDVSGCDVGIQRQAGHTPYPGDGDQNNVADSYFGRGNSPIACGITLSGNILSNTINTRDVGPLGGDGYVYNSNSGETFCTIQSAIDDAQTLGGHSITATAGTFLENVTVNKSVSLNGEGAGNTILRATSACNGNGITISSPNVAVSDLTVIKFTRGILTSAAGIDLVNLVIDSSCTSAVDLSTGTSGLDILNCTLSNTIVGVRIGSGVGVTDFLMDGCEVHGNTQGFYASMETVGGTPIFDDVTIRNSDFSYNRQKGMYFEKLSNALIENIRMDSSGYDPTYNFNAGIDINLKFSSYSNITIQNNEITDCGAPGPSSHVESPCAVTIKARDDSPSYNTFPATLTNVDVLNNVINGPQNGLRFGEFGKINSTPTAVDVHENDLSGSFANKAIINNTLSTVGATCNWFGTTDAPTVASKISGSVTYSPYLTSGTDGDADPGFQPSGSCTGSCTIAITGIDVSNATCFGGNNGSATVNVSGAVGTVTYSWNTMPVQTSAMATGLSDGETYTVAVTDTNGCVVIDSVVVSHDHELPVPTVSGDNDVCEFSTGVIYTTEAGNFGYSWSVSGADNYTPTDNTVSVDWGAAILGIIAVTYTDEFGCEGTSANYEVAVNPSPTVANAGPDQSGYSTCGLTTVTLAANNPSVGTGQWSVVSGVGGSFVDDSDEGTAFSGTAGSTYVLRWTISNPPCTASTDDVSISFNLVPDAISTPSSQTLNCSGTSITPIVLSGSVGGTTFNWTRNNTSNVTGIVSSGSGNISGILSNTTPTSQMVTFTVTPSTATCTGSSINATVNVLAPIVLTTSQVNVKCRGQSNGSANVSVSGGTSPYSYLWSNGRTVANIINLAAGNYTVTVTDANGCTAQTVVTITQPAASLTVSISGTFAGGSLTANPAGGTPGYSYLWNTSATTQCVGTCNGVPLVHQTYLVTVTDANGCKASASKAVKFEDENVTEEAFTAIVYPNPSKDQITLEFSGSYDSRYLVQIRDINGRLMMEDQGASVMGPNQLHYDLSQFAAATYFIFLENAENSKVLKVVLQQ